MIDLSKIVDALLTISLWPWRHEEGEIVSSNWVIAQMIGQDDLPCCDEDIDEECKQNASFVASSPVWLAQLIVALVEEKANHLCWINGKFGPTSEFIPKAPNDFNLTEEKYEELKRRLKNSVQSGQRDVL